MKTVKGKEVDTKMQGRSYFRLPNDSEGEFGAKESKPWLAMGPPGRGFLRIFSSCEMGVNSRKGHLAGIALEYLFKDSHSIFRTLRKATRLARFNRAIGKMGLI